MFLFSRRGGQAVLHVGRDCLMLTRGPVRKTDTLFFNRHDFLKFLFTWLQQILVVACGI